MLVSNQFRNLNLLLSKIGSKVSCQVHGKLRRLKESQSNPKINTQSLVSKVPQWHRNNLLPQHLHIKVQIQSFRNMLGIILTPANIKQGF